jgi:hypothetical protein
MRTIARSFSALLLGCSSLALGSTAQADSRVTLVHSTGSYGAYPHAISNRYYSPRNLHRDHVCALPNRGHSHRVPVRWIDRHGYHHRDYNGYQDKHRHSDRHGDEQNQHRHSHRGDDHSSSQRAYNNHGNRY